MQKIYVLDTNVLLCDPASILSFADRDVVIPLRKNYPNLSSCITLESLSVILTLYP